MNQKPEQSEAQSAPKAAQQSTSKSSMTAIRVRKETRRKIVTVLTRINKKDFGRKIRADELIALALDTVTEQEIAALQQQSMTNADRIEAAFRAHLKRHPGITKDQFLGTLLNSQLSTNA